MPRAPSVTAATHRICRDALHTARCTFGVHIGARCHDAKYNVKNMAATFPHPVSPQLPQVITQFTTLCKMSHKAFHAYITTLPPSEQYFLGCYTLPSSIQPFISDTHSNRFHNGIRQFSASPKRFLCMHHLQNQLKNPLV